MPTYTYCATPAVSPPVLLVPFRICADRSLEVALLRRLLVACVWPPTTKIVLACHTRPCCTHDLICLLYPCAVMHWPTWPGQRVNLSAQCGCG